MNSKTPKRKLEEKEIKKKKRGGGVKTAKELMGQH